MNLFGGYQISCLMPIKGKIEACMGEQIPVYAETNILRAPKYTKGFFKNVKIIYYNLYQSTIIYMYILSKF